MSRFRIQHRGRTAPSDSWPSEKDQARIRALVEAIRAEQGGCALCGARAGTVGIFTPTPSFALRIGQPGGKQRLAAYGLCDQCARLPDVAQRIEQELQANWEKWEIFDGHTGEGLPDS
jgi:hypothetical protein